MEGTGNQRFAIHKRYFLIDLCALLLILWALFGWNLTSRDGIPKGTKYFQVTAGNGVILKSSQSSSFICCKKLRINQLYVMDVLLFVSESLRIKI